MNVTTDLIKKPVEGQKGIFFPSYFDGVSARASIDPESSTGDPLNDLASSLIGLIVTPISAGATNRIATSKMTQKLIAKGGKSRALGKILLSLGDPTKEISKFQGAFTVAVDIYSTDAVSQIGEGVSGDPAATVDAEGFINVTSRVAVRPNVSASSTVDFTPDEDLGLSGAGLAQVLKADGTQILQGTPEAMVSLAVTVGVYDNKTAAYINGNAIVDAGKGITLDAQTLNRFDPSSAYLANLGSGFKATEPKYFTDQGTKILNGGDIVEIKADFSDKVKQGQRYRFLGPNGTETNLASENYENTNRWLEVTAADTGLATFRILTTFLDNNFGLDANLVDVWTQSAANGAETAAIAGSIAVMVLKQNAYARIKDGAEVNQKLDMAHPRTGMQDVTVTAFSENDTIDLGGNFQTPGVNNTLGTTGSTFKTWKRTGALKKGGFQGFTFDGAGGDTKGAVGVTVNTFFYRNNVAATIEDGVSLFANKLDVLADNKVLGIAVGASGGKSEDFTLTGVAVVNKVDNTTYATIGGLAEVNAAGNTTLSATDTTTLVTVAGSLARSEKVGIGASIALNLVNRRTEAYIGSVFEDTVLSSGGSFTTTGGLSIIAESDGFIGTFSVAGAFASNSDEPDNFDTTSVAVGAAVAVNDVDDVVRAYINDGTVSATGTITMSATAGSVFEAFTIGAAIANGDSNSVGIAGSASVNKVDADIQTFIKDSHAGSTGMRSVASTAGGISLTATDATQAFVQAGAVAVAWQGSGMNGKGGRSVAIGASIALNLLGESDRPNQTLAYISNSTVTARDNISATSSVTGKSHALGVGGAVSGAGGTSLSGESNLAGAAAGAFATNVVYRSIQAYVNLGSNVTSTQGGLALSAKDLTTLLRADAFGVAVAYAATVGSPSAAGALAIGVGVARNKVKNSILAYIHGSTVDAQDDISLITDNQTDVSTLGIGISVGVATGTGTTGAIAGAGSAAVNEIDNQIESYIVNAGGTRHVESTAGGVTLSATDNGDVVGVAGALAVAVGVGSGTGTSFAVAAGVSVVLNDIGANSASSIRSYIDSSKVESAGPISLSAISNVHVIGVGVAGSVAVAVGTGAGMSGAFAGAGVGVRNTMTTTIEASIKNISTVTADNGSTMLDDSVSLTAQDNSEFDADAVGATVAVGASASGNAGAIAVGFAVALNKANNNVIAQIHQSTVTADSGDVTLTASEDADIAAVAVAATISVGASTAQSGLAISGGGAIALNSSLSDANAAVISSTITAGDAVNVNADSNAQINAVVTNFSVAVGAATMNGGSAALGAGVAQNYIGYDEHGTREDDVSSGLPKNAQIRAYYENSSVTAGGQVGASAITDMDITSEVVSISVAVGVGGTNAFGLAASGVSTENKIATDVHATITGNGTNGIYAGNIALVASDISDIYAGAGAASVAVAVSGSTSFGLSLGVALARNQIANNIEASITNAGNVNATVGGISLSASENATITAVSVAASIAVSVGQNGIAISGAGAESTNVILSKANAYIKDSTATSKGDVSLTATFGGTIDAQVAAVTGAVGVGGNAGVGASIGAAVARNLIGWNLGAINTLVGSKNAVEAQAYLENSSVNAAGDLSLTATSTPTIIAGVGAGSVAIAVGQVGVGLSGSGVLTENKIATQIRATINGDGASGIKAAGIAMSATDISDIDADAGAASIAGAFGQAGVALTIGLALSRNDITNDVQSFIINADNGVFARGGHLSVKADETATIDTIAVAASVGVGVGSDVGIALSGAGAEGTNLINNVVKAFIENSTAKAGVFTYSVVQQPNELRTGDTVRVSNGNAYRYVGADRLDSNGFLDPIILSAENYSNTAQWESIGSRFDLTVDAKSTSKITAVVGGVAAAVGVGLYGGVAGSVGVSLARNLIGYDGITDDTGLGNKVIAYIKNSTINAAGDVAVRANAKDTMETISFAGSVAVAVSIFAGAFAGSGTEAPTLSSNEVHATIENSSVDAARDLIVSAIADSQITKVQSIGVAVSAAIGISVALTVNASLADSSIKNDVLAKISSTTATTINVGRNLTVLADQLNAKITGVEAVSTSVSIGLFSASGGGIGIYNTVDNKVEAAISGPIMVDVTGDVTVSGKENAYLEGDAVAVTVAISLGAAIGARW